MLTLTKPDAVMRLDDDGDRLRWRVSGAVMEMTDGMSTFTLELDVLVSGSVLADDKDASSVLSFDVVLALADVSALAVLVRSDSNNPPPPEMVRRLGLMRRRIRLVSLEWFL